MRRVKKRELERSAAQKAYFDRMYRLNEPVKLTVQQLTALVQKAGNEKALDEGWGHSFSFEAVKRPLMLLALYFTENAAFEKDGMSLQKGLLLRGHFGSGKSILMELFARNPRQCYQVVSTMQIVQEFSQNAKNVQPVLDLYSRPLPRKPRIYADHGPDEFYLHDKLGWCHDDLGAEGEGNSFGKRNVMLEVLDEIYRTQKGGFFRFYATTNASDEELSQAYGGRIVSRLSEIYNIIEFPAGADLRKGLPSK